MYQKQVSNPVKKFNSIHGVPFKIRKLIERRKKLVLLLQIQIPQVSMYVRAKLVNLFKTPTTHYTKSIVTNGDKNYFA